MAVAEVVTIKDPAQRKRAVKEQIASLGAEIVSGGEVVDNVSSLPSPSSSRHISVEADHVLRLGFLSPDSSHHSTLLLRSSYRSQPQPRPETNPQPYERPSSRHRLSPRRLQGSHPRIPNSRAHRAGAVGEGSRRRSTTERRRGWFGSSLRWVLENVGEGDQGFVSFRFVFQLFSTRRLTFAHSFGSSLYREDSPRRSFAQVHVRSPFERHSLQLPRQHHGRHSRKALSKVVGYRESFVPVSFVLSRLSLTPFPIFFYSIL